MTIVHRTVCTEIIKYFFLVLAAVVGVYLVVDFFEKIDDILDAGLSLSRALVFFALRMPLIVGQVTPVGVLLAVIIVFGLMVKHNETVALKSGGVSIYYMVRPVVVIGFIFAGFLFFFSEAVVPITMAKANAIWQNEVRRASAVTSQKKNIWIKGNRTITHIKYFIPSEAAIFGVTLNVFDEDFRLVRRIDCEKGVYTGDLWRLYNVIEQNLVKEDGDYKITHEAEKPVALGFVPEDLNRALQSEEMSYTELSAYILEVEREGYDATGYRVDLHAKTAFPFVCLIMSMVATGLALGRKKRDGLAGSIFYGIVWAFFYWTLYSLSLSLGYGGVLSPVVAAWSSNVVFFCLGVFMLCKAA